MSDRRPGWGFRVVRAYFRLPPEPGGMEKHIARLSEEQRRLGIEVVNLFNVGDAPEGAVRVWPGRDLLAVRPNALRSLVFYAGAATVIHRIRSKTPTVLHVHGAWSDYVLGRVLAAAIGARALFASMHGKIEGDRARLLYRLALKGYDGAFATGLREARTLSEVHGRPAMHLPSGPDEVFFAGCTHGPATYDVLAVGSLVPLKRYDLIVDMAAARPGLRFAIVGEGRARPALERQIAASGATNIELLGHRSPEAVAQLMEASRVLVSTSAEEGSPTSAMEAMAVGLPVVLTPANDFSALLRNGEGGFVTAGWQRGELLSRLDEVLGDETRRRAMGAVNRRTARQHAWPLIAAAVTERMRQSLECVG